MTISLVGLLIAVNIIGLVLYIIRALPLDPPFKNIAYVCGVGDRASLAVVFARGHWADCD